MAGVKTGNGPHPPRHRITFLFLLVVFLYVKESEEGSLISDQALYGPQDKVTILNGTNLKGQIYQSPKAWVVEFYSSWCGHCIHFAPKWKEFAIDLEGWNHAVEIAGIDCADEGNTPTCRDYDIMGYPTIRFYPPGASQMLLDTKDQKEQLNLGETLTRSENMGDLKRQVIDLVSQYLPNLHTPDLPTTLDEPGLREYLRKTSVTSVPDFVLVLFEGEKSNMGKEIGIHLSPHGTVGVIRFHKKNLLYDRLGLEAWPAAGYLAKNNRSGSILLGKNQSLVDFLLKTITTLADLPSIIVKKSGLVPELVLEHQDSNHLEEPSTAEINSVSMEDLIHAVRNALRNEVGLLKVITGGKLQALKNFVHTLSEYFPGDRREVMIFLKKLSLWLLPFEQIDDSSYMDKLTELELEFHPWDIDPNQWGSCRGSVVGRRGYPCSLWTLFHTLTLISYQKNQDHPVLDSIHGFVKEFFGCRECSGHFTKMVADDQALGLTSIKEQALWLWKAHNKVNLRLKGTLSEDPAFPKQLYPNEKQCPLCMSGESKDYDEEKVLEYLLNLYSKPQRTLTPQQNTPAHLDTYSSNGSSIRRSPTILLFSGSDYWLLCFVYLCVAILLVLGYLHFRSRRRIDASFLLKKFISSGKSNV